MVKIKDNDVESKHNDKNKNELLPLDIVNEIKIEKDGNCFYRTISQAYFGTQNYHEQIRRQIYEYSHRDQLSLNYIIWKNGLLKYITSVESKDFPPKAHIKIEDNVNIQRLENT